jgi:hypothetical protein
VNLGRFRAKENPRASCRAGAVHPSLQGEGFGGLPFAMQGRLALDGDFGVARHGGGGADSGVHDGVGEVCGLD